MCGNGGCYENDYYKIQQEKCSRRWLYAGLRHELHRENEGRKLFFDAGNDEWGFSCIRLHCCCFTVGSSCYPSSGFWLGKARQLLAFLMLVSISQLQNWPGRIWWNTGKLQLITIQPARKHRAHGMLYQENSYGMYVHAQGCAQPAANKVHLI